MGVPVHRKVKIVSLFIVVVAVFLLVWLLPRDRIDGQTPPTEISKAPKFEKQAVPSKRKSVCRLSFQRVCGGHKIVSDPTGKVVPDAQAELDALRIYREIIRKNPDASMEEIDEIYVQKIYSPKTQKRLLSIYTWVKSSLKAMIQGDWPIAPRLAKQLVLELESTELELPPPAKRYEQDPDLLTKTTVIFQRRIGSKSVIRVGGAYALSRPSFYNVVFTMAHELAHAIDPCSLPSMGTQAFYSKLKRCYLQVHWLPNREHFQCHRGSHLAEVFSDHIATEVTSLALVRFGKDYLPTARWAAHRNAVRDLCELNDQRFELDFTQHPPPEIRLGKLYSASPRWETWLPCRPSGSYCSLSGGLRRME